MEKSTNKMTYEHFENQPSLCKMGMKVFLMQFCWTKLHKPQLELFGTQWEISKC